MPDENWEFDLSFRLRDLKLSRNTSDNDLPAAVHKILEDTFAEFEVVIDRVARDGRGNLLSLSVGICPNKNPSPT